MTFFFVPGDYDVTDLDNGDDGGVREPWELVHAVVGFAPVPIEFEHAHEDGSTHTGMALEGHPILLMPCKDKGGVGHAPARAYPGHGTVYSDYKSAHHEAKRILDALLREKDTVAGLEKMLRETETE